MNRSRARLTWEQMLAIIFECRRHGGGGGTRKMNEVGAWGVSRLKQRSPPSYRTMLRILNDKERIASKVMSKEKDRKRETNLSSNELEIELVN